MKILLTEIARQIGAKSNSKTNQMKKALRNGAKFPPIRVALIEDTLKAKLGRLGITTGKRYFLLEGHHRFCVTKTKTIFAKVVRKIY